MNVKALFGQCFCDVEVGDGTEQTTVNTGFLQDLNGQAVHFFTLSGSGSQFFSSGFFQFGTFCFEFLDGSLGCTAGHTLRDQIIAGISVFHFDDFAKVTEIADFFHQNNLHVFLQYSLDYPSAIRRNAGKCMAAGPGNGRA